MTIIVMVACADQAEADEVRRKVDGAKAAPTFVDATPSFQQQGATLGVHGGLGGNSGGGCAQNATNSAGPKPEPLKGVFLSDGEIANLISSRLEGMGKVIEYHHAYDSTTLHKILKADLAKLTALLERFIDP